MWELKHFGSIYDCTGSIGEAIAGLSEVKTAVDGQVPYVNGNPAHLETIPGSGAVVTFRPRVSGKA